MEIPYKLWSSHETCGNGLGVDKSLRQTRDSQGLLRFEGCGDEIPIPSGNKTFTPTRTGPASAGAVGTSLGRIPEVFFIVWRICP